MTQTAIPRPRFDPNPEHVAKVKDEKNDAVSIEYLKLAVEAMKGREMTAKEIADAADVFWEWSQASDWKRG